MKYLLTSHPGFGHFNPMVPIGKALQALGHEVAFTTAPSFGSHVERYGFHFFPAGLDWEESDIVRTFPEFAQVSHCDRTVWIANILWNQSPKAKTSDIVNIIDEWRPDLIVHSGFEWAAAFAAEIKDIPRVMISIAARIPDQIFHMVYARHYRDVRAHLDLPPDEEFKKLFESIEFSFMPPSWAVPGYQPHDREFFFQPSIYNQTTKDSPVWINDFQKQPTVYATLGTVFNNYTEIFDKIIQAFWNKPYNVILTVGYQNDPKQFGPLSDNIRVEQYVPQSVLLSVADVCIHHGGVSAVFDAAMHGVPQLILPLGADQSVNAMVAGMHKIAHGLTDGIMRKDSSGLDVVNPEALTPEFILQAVEALLTKNCYRQAARNFQVELQALPGLDEAIKQIEGMTAESV